MVNHYQPLLSRSVQYHHHLPTIIDHMIIIEHEPCCTSLLGAGRARHQSFNLDTAVAMEGGGPLW